MTSGHFEGVFGRFNYEKERVRGIEPPCAAWEAAVLPLNYTREEIFDFRFPTVRFATRKNYCHEITSSELVKYVIA